MEQHCTQHWWKRKEEKSHFFRANTWIPDFSLNVSWSLMISIVTWQLKSLFQSTVPLQYSFVTFLWAMELANLIFSIYICVWHLTLGIWLTNPSTISFMLGKHENRFPLLAGGKIALFLYHLLTKRMLYLHSFSSVDPVLAQEPGYNWQLGFKMKAECYPFTPAYPVFVLQTDRP